MDNNAGHINNNLPIICNLVEDKKIKGQQMVVEKLFTNVEQILELKDGYAFRYPGTDKYITALTKFISFERKCCLFFTFEMVFEPNTGPIWIRIKGPVGTKDFIKSWLSRQTLKSFNL
jgi:hypothetical protein